MVTQITVIATGGTVAMTSGPSGLRPSQTAGDLVAGLGDALKDISVTLQDAMATPSASSTMDRVLMPPAAVAMPKLSGA